MATGILAASGGLVALFVLPDLTDFCSSARGSGRCPAGGGYELIT